MILLAAALSIIGLLLTATVIFVAVKLFSHYRALQAEEEEEKQNNG